MNELARIIVRRLGENVMRTRTGHTGRRGFTLVESLMAAGILLIMVVAVSSAVSAGQQHAYHAHQRIAGALAAEELMGRLATAGFHDLFVLHEVEPVGTMQDIAGEPFPKSFAGVGREVWITEAIEKIPGLDVAVRGRVIRVRTFDDRDTTLADLSRFVPEPAEDTLGGSGGDVDDDDGGDGDGGGGGLLRWLLRL